MLLLIIVLLFFIIKKYHDTITAIVYSLGIWGVLLLLITEVLSLFHGLTQIGLWISWGAIFFILFIVVMNKRRDYISCYKLKTASKSVLCFIRQDKCLAIWSIYSLLFILMALKLTPFNWDSMTYRLSRVFHWAQNHSVAHYASNIERQIASPSLHEFTMLQAYVMYGTDRFVNMVQCLSYLFNGVLVFNIAKKINISKKWCYFSVLLYYTAPIAFAEGLTTQNDNYATLWTLAFVFLILDFMNRDIHSLKLNTQTICKVSALAIFVGLAYLTKPNVCILMFIFAVGLLVVCIKRKDGIKTVFTLTLLAIAEILVIISPEVYRNLCTFRALAAPSTGARQLVGTVKPLYLLLNFFKVFTFNLPNPWIYGTGDFCFWLAGVLSYRLKVPMNDISIAEDCMRFGVPDDIQYGCDGATNPVVFLLLIGCVVLAIIYRKKFKGNKFENQYFSLAVVSILLFCLILRWEPYVSRYMIAFIAVLCPALTYILSMVFTEGIKKTVQIQTIIVFVCISTLFGLTVTYGKMAIGNHRYSGYFSHDNQREAYEYWSCYINNQGYENIGLMTGENDFEYPLTAMINNIGRMEHVNVDNNTSCYEDESFIPEAIIYIRTEWDKSDFQSLMLCHGYEYHANLNTVNEMGCVYEK